MNSFFLDLLRNYILTTNNLTLKYFIILFISILVVFVYVMFNAMHVDLIVCYIALEGALLSVLVLYGCLSYMFMDVRCLVFLIFLISIAACEIAVGLAFLVRYS